ncbi:hypothetical protein [Flavobacterium rhizosphaerae]|uniref:Uncharacterized protein n=1 Tax=Flavobacterium rhizosphaerae TaxID=3163298 RepID=A0ABW8YZB5_9FLAO
MQHTIIEFSKGNPGAMAFLMELANIGKTYPETAQFAFFKINDLKSLRGTNLYVLWSDLCGKDMDKVVHLLRECPGHILEDACNRQDYSGRALVEAYLTQLDN